MNFDNQGMVKRISTKKNQKNPQVTQGSCDESLEEVANYLIDEVLQVHKLNEIKHIKDSDEEVSKLDKF